MSWISVKDSLPPYNAVVAVWQGGLPYPKVTAAVRFKTDARGEHWQGDYNPACDSREIYDVTHWYGFPKPPQEQA